MPQPTASVSLTADALNAGIDNRRFVVDEINARVRITAMKTEAGSLTAYEGIEESCIDELEAHAKEIEATQEQVRRISAEGVLKIGKHLMLAQELLAHRGNGTFEKWCEERCGISARHARRTIAACEAFSSGQFVRNFDASALYLLAADSTPDDVVQAAIALAESGKKVTHKVAKQLIREAAGEPEDDEPWSITVALDKTDDALQRLEKRWPSEAVKAFGNFLIERGNDLLKYGELPK